MIQKKKLVQFYLEQYEQAGKKRPKRSISTAEMQKRVQTLFRTLRSAKPGRVNVRLLEDYHRQLKNISVYAHRKNRADILKKRYKRQLDDYQQALEQMLQKKVRQKLIYSFALKCWIEI